MYNIVNINKNTKIISNSLEQIISDNISLLCNDVHGHGEVCVLLSLFISSIVRAGFVSGPPLYSKDCVLSIIPCGWSVNLTEQRKSSTYNELVIRLLTAVG